MKEPISTFIKEPSTYAITLDRTSPEPLVKQLCAALRTAVLDGSIPAGTRLPSTRDASRELGVARNVVIGAYEQLEAEGYLEGQAGAGTRATDLGTRKRGKAPAGRRTPEKGTAGDLGPDDPFRGTPSGRRDLVDFASACGTPDLASFPLSQWRRCLARAYSLAPERSFSFPDGRGDTALREEISAYLFRSRGLSCGSERIFVTQGVTHALGLVARFLRLRSGNAVVEDPGLGSFRRILSSYGYGVEHRRVDSSGLVTDALGKAEKGTLHVVSSAHQFPAGGILPAARRFELVSRARAASGWIFEDDYDGDLRLRGMPIPPIAALAPDIVFYAGTFNKTLYPSIRAGYLAVPEESAGSFARYRLGVSDLGCTVDEKALALFLSEGHYDRRIRNLKKLFMARRARLVLEAASAFGDGAAIEGSEAGTHCRLRFADQPGRIDWDGLESHGVRVAPISRFIRTPGNDQFRMDILLGYGDLDEDKIALGIKRLRRFLET